MVMKALRDGASGGITKFILFGFLVLAVGGLVLTDVGGFFRGGASGNDVAKIGKQTISAPAFDNTLRRTLGQIGMSPQDAYRFGYVNQILGSEIRARLISQAAFENGIQVSDEAILSQVRTLVQPFTSQGQSAREVLVQLLRSQGMSEQEFLASIGRDMGNRLIGEAIESTSETTSDFLVQDLYQFSNEKRDVRFVVFADNEVEGVEAPSEAEVRNLYEATKEAFANEETRHLKILEIDVAGLSETLDISDEAVEDFYEDNIALYTTDASWTVEQALISTKDQAQKIYDAVKGGAALRATVEKETGSLSAYLGQETFAADGLLAAIREQVTQSEGKGTLLEPIQSPLGWHVIRVVDSAPTRTQPLSEVKNDIRKEMLQSQTLDQQYELANRVDDMLASGSTPDDVAQEIDIKITSVSSVNGYGQIKEGENTLDKFASVKDQIIENGFSLHEGEASAVFETPEGAFIAVYVESITPKTYAPFEDVQARLSERWVADQKRMLNKMRIAQYLADMVNNQKSLDTVAKEQRKSVQSKNGLKRSEELSAPLVQRSIGSIFEAPLNAPFLLDTENGTAIAVVPKYEWPEIKASDKALQEFTAQVASSVQNETLMLYLSAQQKKYPVSVNQRILDQLYGDNSQSF